jgi:hypothetical protein
MMTPETTTLLHTIKAAAEGLLFPSESDFPIEPFFFGDQEPTPEAIRKQLGLAPDVPVEETTLASFFEGLTETSEDASHEQQACTDRFRTLQRVLETSLEDVRVYRVGTIDIEVIVVGRHPSGAWLGVRTNVVET